MLKKQQRGNKVILSRTIKPNFKLKTLNDIASPSMFLQPTSIKAELDLPKSIKIQLEEEIDKMLSSISSIVIENNINLTKTMNYVRSSIIFKDIDEINNEVVHDIVDEYAKNRIYDLENALLKKQKEIETLRDQFRQQHQFNQQIMVNSSFRKQDTDRQTAKKIVPLEIYNKAKNSSFNHFEQYCKEIQLGHKLQLTKVRSLQPKLKKAKAKFNDNADTKKKRLMYALTPLLSKLSAQDQSDLLQILFQELIQQCNRPCCKWDDIPNSTKVNQTMTNFSKQKSNRSNSYYKSDKINEYYTRYYNNTFKVDKVYSITRTKTEEMEMLYKKYKCKQKSSQKNTHFRSQSIV